MVPIKNPRKVSDVTICLQLTNGERRTGNFSATTNLSDILSKLEVSYHSERSVIIYMQREVRILWSNHLMFCLHIVKFCFRSVVKAILINLTSNLWVF